MFDIETDLSWSIIWVVVIRDLDTGEVVCHRSRESLAASFDPSALWIAHNGVGFDAWILEKYWNLTIPRENLIDTLILSRLWNPELEGGHGLEAWGERYKIPKSLFNDFSQWSQELEDRCIIDTELTAKLFLDLIKKLEGFSDQSIRLEHDVAYIISDQERHGWLFDDKACAEFLNTLKRELLQIEEEMQRVFPPTEVKLKTKSRFTQFNPGSRKQIAQRLIAKGWKPKLKTEAGTIVVNENTLKDCTIPEAAIFTRYLLLQKRISQAESWMKAQKDDGRIHGRINPNGALTSRMTHYNPNMAQVPNSYSPYGKECRSFFGVPSGKKLVGIDASGLELRMLAHYMGDPEYVKTVTQGDVHAANQQAAGLPTRNDAKTFIYAFLYGAGAKKIGSIIGADAKAGMCLVQTFLDNTPALKRLRTNVGAAAQRGWLKGLDGRRIRIRSDHAALNTLLQGAGAILMKQAVVLLAEAIQRDGLDAHFIGNIHDEWQLEVAEADAEAVGKLGVWAIQEAGLLLGLKCPTTGEYKVGNNWSETH